MDRKSSLIFKDRRKGGNKAQGKVHLKTYLGCSLGTGSRNKKPPIQEARYTLRAVTSSDQGFKPTEPQGRYKRQFKID